MNPREQQVRRQQQVHREQQVRREQVQREQVQRQQQDPRQRPFEHQPHKPHEAVPPRPSHLPDPRTQPWWALAADQPVLLTAAKVLMAIAFFTVPFLASYGLIRLLLRATHWQLPGFATFIIQVVCALAILVTLISLSSMRVMKLRPPREHVIFGQSVLEALGRLAQGDFSVVLPVNQQDPLAEVAASVNGLAHNLGDLDQQRRDFVSNVSHEIQSPLTSIGGFAGLLHNPDLDEATRRHYLDIIESETKRLSQLSDTLLKLSALQDNVHALARQNFSLDEQISTVLNLLEPQLQEKSLSLHAELEPLTLTANRELLNLVWVNLIQNALKYTPEDGTLSVTLKAVAAPASSPATQPAGMPPTGVCAVCTVADTGIGLSAQELPHVFERFYRADKSRSRSEGGNGLGLSLVKEIVEAHGGHVSVSSQPGQGTTFTVTLPLQPDTAHS